MTLSFSLLFMATLGVILIDDRRKTFALPADRDPENAPAIRAAMGGLLAAGYTFAL